jgi:hypothetical protein
MTINPHKGEVSLDLAGTPHVLVFDFDALACLEEKFGEDYRAAILAGLDKGRVSVIVPTLVIGLKARHPDVTEAAIRKASPPTVPVTTAIIRALNVSTFGPDVPKADANPQSPASDKG